ncbi:MAG: hypothetical protein QOK37_2170 [Thermoanaerobaculia bacterium]|nr:hypothetical protein [Thermoanaerobaculia bacterium]
MTPITRTGWFSGKVAGLSVENAANRHLTRSEIEQYVTRSGDVDAIIAIAEHLWACFECRDRAVALVDPGNERSVPSKPEVSIDAQRAVPWRLIVICVAIAVAVSAIIVFVLQH